MSAVKIAAFEAENVKRIKAVELAPTRDGLTVIGGANNQGKTSVLDALAWALGGDRLKPSSPEREGSMLPPRLRVELSNGIVVERSGRSSALKVTDPAGNKAGQRLLDAIIDPLALNLPRFLEQSDREKARTLLDIIGVGDKLATLDQREGELYSQRTAVGQMERQKRGAAEEMAHHDGVPAEPVSASELIEQQQAILARNGENQRKRERVREIEQLAARHEGDEVRCRQRIAELEAQLAEEMRRQEQARVELAKAKADLEVARKTAEQLADESTAEIEASLAAIDEVNAKVRENAAREAAMAEADSLAEEYGALTESIEEVRAEKMALLDGAGMPLEGLSVEHGELVYNGAKWDCMSGSDQLKVATAIIRRLKPDCGFVLVDKLEQMDPVTLSEFGEWASSEGLQVIGTRVSTGDECSIIIEDGRAVPPGDGQKPAEAAAEPVTAWEWREEVRDA